MKRTFIAGLALLITENTYSAINHNTTFSPEKPAVTVAVIDTGADIEHPELKSFIWINEGETGRDALGRDKSTNKIDDDGNGFVDDLHGWNFVSNSNDIMDSLGHGTHVSGVIKNEFMKSNTASTLTPAVRLMILKYYNPDAGDEENIRNTALAINYAVRMKARIINYSGGGSTPSPTEMKAIENAQAHHILFIAAAGNNKTNTDLQKYYPANYNYDNIISVAATDEQGELQDFSNYGEKTVDIAAPGKMIFSTLPNSMHGYMSGTSQATAYVTGLAAKILSDSPSLTDADRLIERLKTNSKYNRSLAGKTVFQLALFSK